MRVLSTRAGVSVARQTREDIAAGAMKTTVCLVTLAASVAFSAGADAATRSKHQYVQIQDDATDSALCRETARAVALLRQEIGWPMVELYGHGEGHPDRTIGE